MNVLVVVTVRCLRCDSSALVNRAASVSVLLSRTVPLLTGVLTAEKERAFLGVAAWLSDKDRPPELDCCFLLRSVLRQKKRRELHCRHEQTGIRKSVGHVCGYSYLVSLLVVLRLWE